MNKVINHFSVIRPVTGKPSVKLVPQFFMEISTSILENTMAMTKNRPNNVHNHSPSNFTPLSLSQVNNSSDVNHEDI